MWKALENERKETEKEPVDGESNRIHAVKTKNITTSSSQILVQLYIQASLGSLRSIETSQI